MSMPQSIPLLVTAWLLLSTTTAADVIITCDPTEILAGQPVPVTISLLGSPGQPFDLGAVIFEFNATGLTLLDFAWQNGLDGPDWVFGDELPGPQTVFAGAIGAGPPVSDAVAFPVAILTVVSNSCDSASLDSVPIIIAESTTFEELSIASGFPVPFNAAYGLESLTGNGARYLEVTPAPGTTPIALRVTSPDFPCIDHYVDFDGRLTTTPTFQTGDQWGTVHVADAAIVPDAAYHVQVDCGPPNGLSSPVQTRTFRWGDANGDDSVDLDDIICVLNAFSSDFSTCTPQAADLLGAVPDGAITIDDILAELNAFAGAAYPGPAPCP